MSYQTIDLELRDGVAHLALDQGDAGNPFNEAFCNEWLAVANELAARKDLRAILLTARGKYFSVGGDVRMFAQNLDELPQRIRQWTGALHMGLARFARLDAPMIASVHGVAMGGAVALISACDLVYAGRSAKFGAAYPSIGYCCDAGASRALASRMGVARARRFLLCGETLAADQAAAAGVVDFVIDDAELDDAAGEAAAGLAAGPTRAFGEIRRLFATVLSQSYEAQLEDEAGLKPGAVVGFHGKNSIEYFEAMFGASKAGCALLPLNWRLSALELKAVIEDARPPLILVDREFVPLLERVRETCAVRFEIVEFDSAFDGDSELKTRMAACRDVDPRIAVRAEDTALLLYTSGTTGQPKGVELTHGGINFMRLCEHLEPAFSWQDNDVMMFVMPNFHLVGTGLSLQGLYNGVPLTILGGLDIPALLATIERDKPTICCLVPTAIQMVIDHPDAANTDLSSLRLVMYAGSPITAPLLKRGMSTLRCDFMQFYGATETCGAVTLLRPGQHDLNDERKLKSCGTPVPLVEVRILSAAGDEVPDGEIGEFVVRSPAMFKGYLNKATQTEAALSGGWYRTGDAGYRDADGLLYLVDRPSAAICHQCPIAACRRHPGRRSGPATTTEPSVRAP